MDFVRLGEAYNNDYLPDVMIEGYNSLIWTERHQVPGEFELKSYDVDGLTELLPEDTLVSHLETLEVMQVETHTIEMVGEGEDAQPEITIKGRSATKILEHRWVEAAYQKKRKMRKKYTGTSAAGVLLVNAIDNNSGFDLTRGDDDPDTEGVVNSYPWTIKDKIPNVAITEVVASEGSTRWWQLKEGLLLPQLLEILFDADLGIRCLRPVLPNSAKVITVLSNLADRGTVVRTMTDDVDALRFEIYDGIDRSDSVKFSLLQGHIDSPQYLTSNLNHKTVVEVMSDEVSVSDVYKEGDVGLTGWERKTVEYDAGSPEIPPKPEKPDELPKNATNQEKEDRADAMDEYIMKLAKWKNKKDQIVEDFRLEAEQASLRVLKKHRRLNMFSGDVSDLSPYKYKTHYDLGDTVMLIGDYGKKSKMVVSEYVRTENADGDRGFPGLVAP